MTVPNTAPPRLRADAAILAAALLWATTGPALRYLIGDGGIDLSKTFTLAIRFTVAAAAVALWRPAVLRVRGVEREWAIALWLGLLMGGAYVTQLIGLDTIAATRSHFITNLSVVFVPLMQTFYLHRRPSRGALAGVALALTGLGLLTDPFHGRLTAGDLWTLLCALTYTLYMIELQRLGPMLPLSRLLFGQFLLIAGVTWPVWVVSGGIDVPVGGWIWALLLYLAVMCTLVTIFLHNRFQRDTTPTRAALIFALGPVFTFAIAWLTLGETLAPVQIVGALLIVVAVAVTELL
jgi:drug/metabolite transporter (DMT)-like permease